MPFIIQRKEIEAGLEVVLYSLLFHVSCVWESEQALYFEYLYKIYYINISFYINISKSYNSCFN